MAASCASPHGGSVWEVIAAGRKLPSQLKPIPRGMAWSYEIPLGYVVEAFIDGRPVTLFERQNAQLKDLTVDGDWLVLRSADSSGCRWACS